MAAPLLVTTSHSLLKVDPASGAHETVHRGRGLYFGIATDGDRRFVAARGRMVSSDVASVEERGSVLVFDRALQLVDEVVAPFPLRDMHEILWHDGRLWITCSFDNMIAIHAPATGGWERWYPLGETAQPPLDVNHFNSLAIIEGELGVVAHNFGASELLRFDLGGRKLRSRVPFGMQSHNIRRMDSGALLTCSSAEGALLATDGWRLETGGFPRGILTLGNETYVGISEKLERKDRDLSTGRIAVFDAGWRLLRTLSLPGEGLLLEIAPLA